MAHLSASSTVNVKYKPEITIRGKNIINVYPLLVLYCLHVIKDE